MSGADSLDLDSLFLDKDHMADEISNQWSGWNGAREPAKQRWHESTQYVFATSTRETVNANVGGFLEDSDGWNHSSHIPKLTQIADNLAANLMAATHPHEDWFQFIGEDRRGQTKEKRKVVESYLKTKHRLNNFRNTEQQWINDWVLYGNCFGRVDFVNETVTDPKTGEVTTAYVGPTVSRISPYDIVFNPLATDFEHSPKIIRSLKTLGELSRDAEERPELGYSTDILAKVQRLRGNLREASTEDIDKSIQLSFDGFSTPSQYFNSGFVEILEFYGDMYDIQNQKFLKNRVITVVDKTWVIRNEDLDTWTGRPNIFHCGWRLRPDNLWAMGPLDNLVGMQYLINHLSNARADAFDQHLAPTRVVVGNVEKEGVEVGVPGGEYIIPDGDGSVTNLAPDTLFLQADNQVSSLFNIMEEFVGAPRQSMGIRTPGEKTLGEINTLERNSGRIFQNKASYFEENFLEKILNAELEVAKRNLIASDTIKVIDDDTGVQEFMDITKQDITANGKLVPMGARHFARQAALAANLQAVQSALTADPMMAEHFPSERLAKLWIEVLELDKHDLLVPFGRVAERTELQRLSQASEQIVGEEDLVADDAFQEEPDTELLQ